MPSNDAISQIYLFLFSITVRSLSPMVFHLHQNHFIQGWNAFESEIKSIDVLYKSANHDVTIYIDYLDATFSQVPSPSDASTDRPASRPTSTRWPSHAGTARRRELTRRCDFIGMAQHIIYNGEMVKKKTINSERRYFEIKNSRFINWKVCFTTSTIAPEVSF